MKQIIAECSCTLPEGAILILRRVRNVSKTMGAGEARTMLIAQRDARYVKMRVQDVSQASMQSFLDLIRKEIMRYRMALTMKPAAEILSPRSIKDFTQNMAAQEMFYFMELPANKTGNPKSIEGMPL